MEINNENIDRANSLFIFLVVALILIFTVGCNESGGSNPVGLNACQILEGTHLMSNDPLKTLTLNADCTFTDSHCRYQGHIEPKGNGEWSIVHITYTNNNTDCMAAISQYLYLEWDDFQLYTEFSQDYFGYIWNLE